MTVARLKTELRVQGWVRRCMAEGFMATVARKGDPDAGALLLKVNRFGQGCEVFSGVTGPSGEAGWLRGTGPAAVAERDADAYIARQTNYDPDLWVLEIEDPKGQFVLDAPAMDL